MSYTVIAIAREYGSGGRIIAQRLAEKLDFSFYDKELIDLAARESGFSPDFIKEAEQQKTNSFLYGIYAGSHNLPISDQIFVAQSNVIKKLASEKPCVIVGRCADYVLRGRNGLLRVFVHAPVDQRIRRAVKEYGVPPGSVHSVVHKTDKSRAAYYNHFTSGKWGLCQSYDVAINSSLGIDLAVDMLYGMVKPDKA